MAKNFLLDLSSLAAIASFEYGGFKSFLMNRHFRAHKVVSGPPELLIASFYKSASYLIFRDTISQKPLSNFPFLPLEASLV